MQGVIVTSPCDVGFHFASFWEISDPSKLSYDRDSRGRRHTTE